MNEDIKLKEEFNDHSSSLLRNGSETSSEILYKDASPRSKNNKNVRTKKDPYTSAVYDKSVHQRQFTEKTIIGSEIIVTEYNSAGNPTNVIDPIRKVRYTHRYNKKSSFQA